MIHSPGKIFRQALRKERPLQLIGVTNALTALMAQEAGYKALYLSGAGVANNDLGLPDLGLTSLDDVLILVRRITSRTALPLIVDVDTGWGSPLNVYRTFFEISKAGAAGAHIEDQSVLKRCGHRPGKKLVPIADMMARIHAALEGRRDPHLVNKPAAVFTSSSSIHGGQESTLLSMMLPLMHHGAYIIGIPYSEAALTSTQSGGTPYGASHVAGSESNLPLSEDEKTLCFALGKRLGDLVMKLQN